MFSIKKIILEDLDTFMKSNEFLSFYAAHGKRRWTRDIGEVFRHDARG